MELDPVAVALKFGFIAVLYLFLLWVARSALRDLRGTGGQAAGVGGPDHDATAMHAAGSVLDAPFGMPRLRVESAPGLRAGAVYDLSGGALLGRGSDADIVLEDSFSSSRHARLIPQGDAIVLEDLGSTNGTYLNEEPLSGPQPLHDGDRIKIGSSEFLFEKSVMLRVVEKWQGSDVGRQRQGNEDNFFVQAPLFVLADGMGGAQAGEVASEIAIEAFRSGLPDGQVEDGLVARIDEANAKVHEEANAKPEYHGMGTTCTVAYVAEEEVVLAHVGDSRAYLLRDGELTRLTRDHSLVGELVDRGKVTEEEALTHPQRSVITRAVGPEPTVQVDTDRIAARSGDVFLLCSDGLTDMVRDRDVQRVLTAVDSLEPAGRNLIAAANAAGGRDNITVILFRLEEVETGSAVDTSTQETTASSAVAEPTPQEDQPSKPPPRTMPPPPRAPAKPAATGRRRFVRPLIVVAILLALFGTAAFVAMRGVFFVGLDGNRTVTIYRGLPYIGPFGLKLYTRDYTSGVRIDQVPADRQKTFTNHKLRSLDDATDLVKQLETGTIK